MTSDGGRFPDHERDARRATGPIVEVISDLVNAATQTAEHSGHLPVGGSPASHELEVERRRFAGKSAWVAPLRDTHWLGALTLLAAGDHLRAFAALLAQEEAPTYAHLVLTRAAMEACVIAAWLNDPVVDADQRVKRGLVERLYSARQQQRSRALRPDGQELDAQLRTVAASLRWTVTSGRTDADPVVAGVSRPNVASAISQHLVGDRITYLGQVLWAYLSGVAHTAWYALSQPISEAAPVDDSGTEPPLTAVATGPRSIDLQAVCLIRLYLAAADNRMALMGWHSAEWSTARRRAESLHDSLMRSLGST